MWILSVLERFYGRWKVSRGWRNSLADQEWHSTSKRPCWSWYIEFNLYWQLYILFQSSPVDNIPTPSQVAWPVDPDKLGCITACWGGVFPTLFSGFFSLIPDFCNRPWRRGVGCRVGPSGTPPLPTNTHHIYLYKRTLPIKHPHLTTFAKIIFQGFTSPSTASTFAILGFQKKISFSTSLIELPLMRNEGNWNKMWQFPITAY